jgi:hypothetical protein
LHKRLTGRIKRLVAAGLNRRIGCPREGRSGRRAAVHPKAMKLFGVFDVGPFKFGKEPM